MKLATHSTKSIIIAMFPFLMVFAIYRERVAAVLHYQGTSIWDMDIHLGHGYLSALLFPSGIFIKHIHQGYSCVMFIRDALRLHEIFILDGHP